MLFDFFLFVTTTKFACINSQDTRINLKQGTIVGLKVFPESSRTGVFTFLGIPYAEPPTGNLRYSLPQPNRGWNQTIFAKDFKPICLQLTNSIYDEHTNQIFDKPAQMSEDCLYLNIWTPEIGLRFGNLPVLVIITGEEMMFDWLQNRPSGLDLATEGVIVVTIQYRSNIFGWLHIENIEGTGKFGFYDQELALNWIQENIFKFGGNPKRVTVLFHGGTGCACGYLHLTNPKSDKLFSKAILMSAAETNYRSNILRPSKAFISKLRCESATLDQILLCLKEKSSRETLKAYESVFYNGNYTNISGLISDNKTNLNLRFIAQKGIRNIPLLIGICTNEGAFISNYWIDLAKEGYGSLEQYINNSILPSIIEKYATDDNDVKDQIIKAIYERFFEKFPKTVEYLLYTLQRLISETKYENPFYEIINNLVGDSGPYNTNYSNLFVYTLHLTNSMDMRGIVNLFGGASHASDLPLLMGPSLFQQIARRRLTQKENEISRNLKTVFLNFIKTGKPTTNQNKHTWLSFTAARKFIKILGENYEQIRSISTIFIQNLPFILKSLQLSSEDNRSEGKNNNEYSKKIDIFHNISGESEELLFSSNKKNTNYYNHLQKVHSFWKILIQNLYSETNLNRSKERNGKAILSNEKIKETTKYKQAFFSMLILVCLLLATLTIFVCVLHMLRYNL